MPVFRKAAFTLFALTFFSSLLFCDRSVYSQMLFSWQGPDAPGFSPWTVLTGLFCTPADQLLGVCWAGVVQWFLGSEVEAQWGSRRYLLASLFCGVCGLGSLFVLGPLLDPQLSAAEASGPLALSAAAAVFFARTLGTIQFRPFGGPPIAGAWLGTLLAVVIIAWPMVVGVSGVAATLATAISALVALLGSLRWNPSPSASNPKRNASHLRVVRSAEDMLN